MASVSLTSAANFSASYVWNPFTWFFGIIPAVQVTVGTFQLDYKFGHLEPVFATIQPPAVTVNPAPFAFLAPASLNASQVKGQLVIEGGDQSGLLRRLTALVDSGVRLIVLLALSDDGAPAYDHELAAACAALGAPAFACTPDQFPDLLASAIRRDDLAGWVARNGIGSAG